MSHSISNDNDDFLDLTRIQDMYFQQVQAIEDEEQEVALALAGIVVFIDQEINAIRNSQRARRRQHLLRADLLPNPRHMTPWSMMYRKRHKHAFITTMGIDPETFQSILDNGFQYLWDTTPIFRPDREPGGIPRPRGRSLDAAGALGLVLHYLCSTMAEISLCEIFALIPASVNRYITFALSLFLQTLRQMPDAQVRYPRGAEFQQFNDLISTRHPRLTGAFGSMDGLNLPVQISNDEDIENATYNGWLHSHFVSSVFAFGADGTIIACNLNAPGSWHDSRVAQPIYRKLQLRTPEGYYLVADSAFPRGTQDVATYIQVPLKQNSRLPDDEEERNEVLEFNRQLLSYRQTAEWGMRSLQGSFGRLRIPLSISYCEFRAEILETITRLHNLRTRCAGINQIRSVYMPIWTEGEQFMLQLGNMIFAEVRKNDRVSRFHITAEEVNNE